MADTDKNARVVIVGCGVAGPVLGMFLRRLGRDVVICEGRTGASRDEGAFLGVAPNGMNVLAALGVHDAIEAVSVPCRSFSFLNAGGACIGTIDRSRDTERFGAGLRMIRRADLHRVLAQEASARGVEVHFGRSLVDVDTSDATQVVARFSDGGTERGGALVGCDGIGSITRRQVLPDAPRPAYTGLLDFGGFARGVDAPLEEGVNVMVFGRRAFFGAFRTPSGEIWWFHNGGEKDPGVTLDPAARRARILALHRDDPSWIADVIGATDDILGPWPLHDILTMPRWYRGRVCLVGDAAHATTPSAGQGASMALEDAMVLARQLRDAAGPEAAFAAFERERRARVEAVVAQSRRTGSGKALTNPIQLWMRDRMLPFFLRLGARAQDRSYAHRIAW